MNIFGHAWVATRITPTAGFVLGALLPDVEQMVGGRIVEIPDEDVSRGAAFHHQTDAVFHDSPAFIELCAEGRQRLAEAGVRRGPSLAAAHVGVEMLIDGFIADVPSRRLFREALDYRVPLRWRDPSHAGRFDLVCSRLRDADIPDGYRDTAEVARQLERILHRRPRLRLQGREPDALARWLKTVQPAVEQAVPDLQRRLKAA